MGEYKRWKHATWAVVFMLAGLAMDSEDDTSDDDFEHSHDFDQDSALDERQVVKPDGSSGS